MTTRRQGPVVLLSDSDAARELAESLAPLGLPVTRCANIEELLRELPLSSVEVLVAYSRGTPRGSLLVTLGKLGLEYPRMQKVAVMEGPPPLSVAGYLTACGVDLVWEGNGDERTERLTSVVERMRDRRDWVVA